MRKSEETRISKLTAKSAGRSATVTQDDIQAALLKIDEARRSNKKTVALRASGARLENELKARGFQVQNTGVFIHISW